MGEFADLLLDNYLNDEFEDEYFDNEDYQEWLDKVVEKGSHWRIGTGEYVKLSEMTDRHISSVINQIIRTNYSYIENDRFKIIEHLCNEQKNRIQMRSATTLKKKSI
jgi:hypothetical protein